MMMFFAMPSIVRADEGEEPTTPTKLTLMVFSGYDDDDDPIYLNGNGSNEVARYYSVMAMIPNAERTDDVRVYYTYDAAVTLSYAAYEAQTDGKILLAEDPYGMSTFALLTDMEEDNATLRVVACLIKDGSEVEAARSDVGTYALTFTAVAAPTFEKPTGSDIEIGDLAKITNSPEGDSTVYTFGDVLPTFTNQDDSKGVKEYYNGISIQGTVGQSVTIKAINYDITSNGYAGSKMTTVTYNLISSTNTFTFAPASGTEVEANAAITVTASKGGEDQGISISYKWFATEEAANAAVYDDEWDAYSEDSKPQATVALPVLKVVALNVMGDVINYGTATYTVYGTATYTVKAAEQPAVAFTITPAPTEAGLDAGTEITVAYSDVALSMNIMYKWFADEAAAKAAEWDIDDNTWKDYVPTSKPVLTEAMPVLKVIVFDDSDDDNIVVAADSVVVYTVVAGETPEPGVAVPAIDKAAGAYEAGTVITVAKGTADSIFVATGKTEAEATAFVKATADVTVRLTADTVIRAYAMKDGKHSDTVARAYTIRIPVVDNGTLTVTPDGTSVVEEGDEVTYEVETEYEGYTVRYKWYADMATAEADNTYKNYGEGCETVGEDTKLIISKETPVLAIGVGTGVIEDEFAWVIAPKYFTYTFAGEDPEVTITLSPVSGTEVEEGDTVKITCSDETVVVHFMMFDTKANAEAISEEDWEDAMIEYGEPVEDDEFIGYPVITKEKPVIKVGYAIVDEEENSTWHFTYAVYTVKGGETPVTTVAKPTFSVEAGAVEKGTKVVLACTTEGAKIYYTVNGEEPTAESTEYTAEISIDSAMTIKAIAVKEGMTNSEVAEAAYTIKSVANQTNELAGVSIYPNPTDGEFSVVAPANAQVEIFTAAGVLVKRMVVAEGNAQVRLDNSGIYFVRVRANGQAAIRKVVVR